MKKTFTMFLISILLLITNISFPQIYSKKSGNWNSTSTWSSGSVPTSSDAVIIDDGHTVTINANANCKNLTIGQGGLSTATLTFDGSSRTLNVSGSTTGYVFIFSNGVLSSTSGANQTIYVVGDFTNNGKFTQGSSNTVNFNGSSYHGIYGSNIVFNNLTINNAGGIGIATDITVNNTLTLSSGLLYTTNDTLTVNGSISVSTPGSTKMIVLDDGLFQGRLKLKTATNKSYLFPVGDTRGTDEYSPATINLTSGANSSAYISINMKNIKDPNNSSPTNYLNRFWTFTPLGLSSFAYNITINYLNNDVTGSESQLYFAKYDGGVWTLLGQPNTTSNTYTTTSALTSFSTFTGGEAGSLPVQLQSLYSSVSGRNAIINWKTSSENNNKGFDILRASVDKNGVQGNFESIGFVSGNGTTSVIKSYSFTDKNLNTGKYKYRLKQTDNNGNFEYFDLNGIVEIGVPGKFSLSQNYPNPFNPMTKIDFELPADGKVSLVIYDIAGKEVAKVLTGEFKNAGYHTVEFNGGKLSSGIYMYRLTTESSSVTKKMMLVK